MWSIEFIDHFSQLLIWVGEIYYPEPVQDGEFTFLGENKLGLVNNQSLPLSIEFINHFESKLELKVLELNSAVFEKVFKPFVDDLLIDKVMRSMIRIAKQSNPEGSLYLKWISQTVTSNKTLHL